MNLKRVLPALLPVVLLGAAVWVLHRELAAFRWRDVSDGVEALPGSRLLLAVLVTAVNYALLTLYDVLALAYVNQRLAYPRVGVASFVAYAFGNNVGVAMLSSASVRYRFYSAWGLSALDITRVAVFCGLTLWLGLLATGGVAFAITPVELQGLSVLSSAALRGLGRVLLLLTVGYVAACARWRAPLTVRGHTLTLPSPRLALSQLVVSGADWLLAAWVLFLLLPPGAGLSLPVFIALFMLGQVAGLISQVPGGLGVFESIMLAALTPRVPTPAVLGMLVAYRAIYYLGPFGVASLVLAGNELLQRREQVTRVLSGARASVGPVVPLVAATAAVIAGAILLFSGATPTEQDRLLVLRRLLPLSLVELSHLLGSLVGMSLLLLGRGLQRRLDAAYVLALGLLVCGGVVSLVKGIDYEEATLLFALALALGPFREQFYRRTSLFAERFSPPWLLAIGSVVGASVWLGFFSYRHVDYSNDLWWRFTFDGDAPRFLRASMAVVGVALMYGVARLLAPTSPHPLPPTEEELALARPLVARAPESTSHLALVGDKTLLFNEKRTAFLMYGVSGRTWVAMGEPVCATPEEGTELAWRFRELVDAHHGWTCFYQVGPSSLPRYLDLGLALLKLGEEATVPLADFRLDVPERRGL
ncbi:MAG: bifunctional lysylphosphatidylglycerol flippase/synthetase MprF, partial [Archangium sp.]